MTTNFHNYLHDDLSIIYQKAREYITVKSRLEAFPEKCSHLLQKLLDKD